MLKIFRLTELRNKILFTLGVIVLFRFFAHIPVPGVNVDAIRAYLQQSALLGLYDYFSGGGFQNFSIVTLGLGPYINASIIIQLMTMMLPKFEELSKEGESGREVLNQYTRYLTVPISLFQAYGMYFLLSRQGIITELGTLDLAIFVATLTGGGMLLVWIGDLLTEYGIGNGISLLIFVGIISRLPQSAFAFFTSIDFSNYMNLIQPVIFLIVAVLVIVAVVLINEGTRNIALEYGRRGQAGQRVSNYLPIKINQAGVIPIIFAVSIVMLPSMISAPLQASTNTTMQNIGSWLAVNFQQTSWAYNAFYFLLVFGFTYFYTAVQFDPEKISDDIKKRGGFILGVRPGTATKRYLRRIITRITLGGALFLGLIAIMPFIVQLALGGNATYSVGGTGLLIVVSVVLETARQMESMMVTRNYDSFLM